MGIKEFGKKGDGCGTVLYNTKNKGTQTNIQCTRIEHTLTAPAKDARKDTEVHEEQGYTRNTKGTYGSSVGTKVLTVCSTGFGRSV